MRFPTLLAAVLGAVWLCSPAAAIGGKLVFEGGSPREQTQVRDALAVSSFDWDVLPRPVDVHIGALPAGGASTPGNVFLDPSLLDSGEFSWGVVQHEFGHQVDFLRLDDGDRATLQAALGARDWCYELPGLSHEEQGCERFASELAWAYWPSSQNSMRPEEVAGESDAMAPDAFRSLLGRLLATPGASSLTPSLVSAPPDATTTVPSYRVSSLGNAANSPRSRLYRAGSGGRELDTVARNGKPERTRCER